MAKPTCSLDGCENVLRCKGFCGPHYGRWLKHGDPRAHIPLRQQARDRICNVGGCSEPVRCKGMCGLHYDRLRLLGATSIPPRKPRPLCSIEGCDRLLLANGYCNVHDQRARLTGDPQADVPIRPMPSKAMRDDICARIADRSVRTDKGCLEWRGPTDRGSYGSIGWRGKTWRVHIAAWVVANGPIPDGDWTLDHLCYNRRCSEVTHLELVTRAENTMRAMLRKYAKADRLPEPVLEFLRAASQGTLEGKNFFDAWTEVA